MSTNETKANPVLRTPENVRQQLKVTAGVDENHFVLTFEGDTRYANTFTVTRTVSELDGVSFGCYQTALRARTLDGLLDRFAEWIAGPQ